MMYFLPESTSLIADAVSGHRLVGADIAAWARTGAARLSGLGAHPGTSVLLCHGGTPRFFADLFAIWRTGAAAACINPATTRSELERIVDFLSPVAVLVNGNGDGDILGRPVVDLAATKGKDDFAAVPSNLDDDALVLFTSGTTGEPKGVVLSFRSLLARVALNRVYIGDRNLKTTLNVLPTHFGHGLIGNCLTPLFAGADLILAPANDLKSVAQLGGIVDRFGVTFMSSVPAYWKIALKAAKPPRENRLRRIHIGSAPLSSDLWTAVMNWSATRDVVNMYGMTEAANWIAGASATEFDPRDGLIGRVWGGSARIRDEDGQLSSSGEGDLVVQTPSLMKGYLKRDDLTATALNGGWLATGDVGNIDVDGTIRLTGRRKYEINRAGLKVHPEDIDILLERHPEVIEACAFAVPDPITGESVGVAVVLRDGSACDGNSLRAWVAERLLTEKVPTTWYVVSDIPKTDRGKINRDEVARACRQKAARTSASMSGGAA